MKMVALIAFLIISASNHNMENSSLGGVNKIKTVKIEYMIGESLTITNDTPEE